MLQYARSLGAEGHDAVLHPSISGIPGVDGHDELFIQAEPLLLDSSGLFFCLSNLSVVEGVDCVSTLSLCCCG